MNITDPVAGVDYEMDPAVDDLLFEGTELRDGMIVLPEARRDRDPERRGSHADQWRQVTRLRVRPTVICGQNVDLVEFIGVYVDGYKAKESMGSVNSWIVRKDSVPQ
jgi:hypothetical protein